MNIFLVGFMGSGKSTLGLKLAETLGSDFVDLDRWIEINEAQSITNIFDVHGEQYFRNLESKSLKIISKKNNQVIATGGGTPCFEDNMSLMKKKGIVIYLLASEKVLSNRLITDSINRPLIEGLNSYQLQKYIRKNLKARRPFYQQAHFTVRSSSIPEKIVNRILNRMKKEHEFVI